jgi:hypothetical protein
VERMQKEFVIIESEIDKLEKIVKIVVKKKIQIYYHNYSYLKNNFLTSLREIKEELLKTEYKLKTQPGVEHVKDFIFLIEELHQNIIQKKVEEIHSETLEKNVEEMKNVFSGLKALSSLEELKLEFDVGQAPIEIRSEIATDFDEIVKCNSSEAYRAVIAFCGRMLETALAWEYWKKKGIDPIKQKWTLGTLINECEKAGIFAPQPGLHGLCNMINEVRIPSIHRSRKEIYLPSPQDAKSIFQMTQSAIRRLIVDKT